MFGYWKAKINTAHKSGYGLLYAAILIALATRVFHLGYQSIWGDESLTLFRYAKGSNLIDFFRQNWELGSHPPLFFLVVYYWYKLGHSEFMLRFPSMVFGVASIPVAYALVNRLFGKQTAGIAALIFALSPIHIWYSQEARMYTLQMLLCLASTFYFVKALHENRAKDYGLYVLFTVMAFFAQISTMMLVVAQGSFVIIYTSRDRIKMIAWLWVLAQVLLVCTPWITNSKGLHHMKGVESGFGFARQPSILDAGYVFYTFSVGYSLGPSVAELHQSSASRIFTENWDAILLPLFIFGLLAILGLMEARRTNDFGFRLLLAIMVIPVALSLALAVFKGIPIYPRYLFASAIPYWVAISLGIQRCFRARALRGIPIFAAMVMAFSLYNYYWQPDYAKQDLRSATMLVNKAARPGDVVVISSIEIGGPFIYYFKRHDVPYIGYPSKPGMIDPNALPHDMESVLRHKKRAWLVLGKTWSSDPKGLIPDFFDHRYHPLMHRHYAGITILNYDLTSKPIRHSST